MRSGNTVFTAILIIGLLVGIGLMVFNSNLFDEISGTKSTLTKEQAKEMLAKKDTPDGGKTPIPDVVIAGKQTPYLEFSQEAYDKALQDKKIVVLNFYANWCPICRAEEPDVKAAFNSLNNPNVVGFQVNYNDDRTDAAEEALARRYGVTYQHTKVILKDGKQVLKETAQWSKETFISQINAASAN